ncbi:hypothetical protein MFRU_021g01020 [Monilinia fructicola]|nr:hypothetical protein MFRU_021g01020 [Monilinia fructicola]
MEGETKLWIQELEKTPVAPPPHSTIPAASQGKDEDIGAMIPITSIEVDSTLVTSFGTTINRKDTLAGLADRAFAHASTAGSNPTGLRYNEHEFHGAKLDSEAAKKSTAGYRQYLAYEKLTNSELDTPTAGNANITFGIRQALSIGSGTVNSPLGIVEFHILESDTPFLTSLAKWRDSVFISMIFYIRWCSDTVFLYPNIRLCANLVIPSFGE